MYQDILNPYAYHRQLHQFLYNCMEFSSSKAGHPSTLCYDYVNYKDRKIKGGLFYDMEM